MHVRAGTSLVELLAALTVGAIVLAMLAGGVLVQVRVGANVSMHSEANEARAVGLMMLDGELRASTAADVSAIEDESITLRAFRGTGIVCDTANGIAAVRLRGVRLPEPARDSILVLHGSAEGAAAFTLHDSAPAACEGAGDARVLMFGSVEPLAPGNVLLVFEHGSYHLVDRALRWRPRGGGRQPLTGEVLSDAGSGFDDGTVPAVRITLRAQEAGIPPLRVPLRSLNTRVAR